MSETPTANPNFSTSTSDIDRVKASFENRKRKLLDLTKRNRALNFKVNKVSTITIIDEQPARYFGSSIFVNSQCVFKLLQNPTLKGNKG